MEDIDFQKALDLKARAKKLQAAIAAAKEGIREIRLIDYKNVVHNIAINSDTVDAFIIKPLEEELHRCLDEFKNL